METVFVTTAGERTHLMIGSLREFGGILRDAPVWTFGGGGTIQTTEHFPLHVPGSLKIFDLAEKVMACAEAEKMAAGKCRTLIWMSPDCLVLNPPVLYLLTGGAGAALRPAHVRNIGQPAGYMPDVFWEKIYASAGKPSGTVKTFIGDEVIAAYYNTHAFSVDPDLGLMQKWADIFLELAADRDFTQGPCVDLIHRVFIHQAAFSALLASELGESRILALPPGYNYPYNLQDRVPENRRARALNDLVTAACEGRELHPEKITDISVSGKLRQWLADSI